MKHYYFAYGSNTNIQQMQRRCPDAENIGIGILSGYRLIFRGPADIELDLDSETFGVLWQISDSDLKSLDYYEGFPTKYLRQRVLVWHNDLKYVTAWVYAMADQSYRSKPKDHYYEICCQGYLDNSLETFQLNEALSKSQPILE